VVNGPTFEIRVFGSCGLGGDYGEADLFSFSDHGITAPVELIV